MRRRKKIAASRVSPRTCLRAAVAIVALGSAAHAQRNPATTPMQPLGDGSPKRTPPVITEFTVEPVADARTGPNALLLVRFDAKSQVRSPVRWLLEQGPVELRDDGRNGDKKAGDGVFSALTTVDLKALAQEQRRSATVFAGDKGEARFVGRVQVPRKVDLERLRPQLDILRQLDTIQFRRPFPILDLPWVGTTSAIEKSLMITDVGVVGDPTRTRNPCTGAGAGMGKWSFGHLMTAMANQPATGINPSTFVRNWLAKWETAQTVNGFTIPARNAGIHNQIINPWQAASGGGTAPLDLSKAPFRLLAIVNRVDLRENLVYGNGSAGEARFVFGAVRTGPGGACQRLPFTVIFEYGVPKSGCPDVRAWAKQWINLSTLTPGTPAYATALEAITDQFAEAGKGGAKPNGSALNQLRTNEIALSNPWELREFVIGAPGQLEEATVKQSPDISFNNSATLASYVNTNAALIVADRHVIPLNFSGSHFLAASGPTPSTSLFWGRGSTMTVANSRFHLSLNTCSGCHAGETGTAFTHISPILPATGPAALSGFLTGIDVADPDPSDSDNSVRHFADLDRRRTDLNTLGGSLCIRQPFFRPLMMTH